MRGGGPACLSSSQVPLNLFMSSAASLALLRPYRRMDGRQEAMGLAQPSTAEGGSCEASTRFLGFLGLAYA